MLHFAAVKSNPAFDNGDIPLLLAVSEDKQAIEKRDNKQTKLATLVISREAFARGLCPGAVGYMPTGKVVESNKVRALDGKPWLKIDRGSQPIVLTKEGVSATGVSDIVFQHEEPAEVEMVEEAPF